MPTPEELKKLSREYAEDVFRKCREHNINHLTDEEWELSIDEVAKDTTDAFQWLSKDYCIVPKSKVKKWEGIVENALKADPVITEPAFRFMWERLFGKDMFEEEGK